MVDVAELIRPRALADDAPLARGGRRARRLPARDGAPRRQRRRPASASRRSSRVLRERSDLPVVLPLHPRTRARLEAAGLLDALVGGRRACASLPPLGYVAFTALLAARRARCSRTPAACRRRPTSPACRCVTLRDTTEWVETVDAGWNVLVDLDVDAARAALARRCRPTRPELYGDGHAGARVVAALGTLAA